MQPDPAGLRLECLRLAFEWAKMHTDRTYSLNKLMGIAQEIEDFATEGLESD